MSAVDVLESAASELVDDSAQFFAPVASDLIDQLLGRYQSEREKVERIAHVITSPEYAAAVSYFLDGAGDRHTSLSVKGVFDVPSAVRSMNRRYWSDALALTDVYASMPQARRDFWNAQIRGDKFVSSSRSSEKVPPLPDFEEATVRNTLGDLLAQRAVFFAERIDGIFRNLSSTHVTNVPEGFSKRMIIDYMLNYGSIRSERAGLIHDLRCVIAKFMGRDDPAYASGDVLLREMYKCTGQWVSIDAGALRIRVYKKGTAHLEVHPDMAYRLNQVLATLHPRAIPAQFRTKPAKRAKEFQMLGRPLPFATLELLARGLQQRVRADADNTFKFEHGAKEHKATYADACAVLEALGGTPNRTESWVDAWEFDYPIAEVLREVIISGCLPDRVAHQFYPTPEKLARIAVEWADIGDADTVLEPSAGQGGIADHLPKDRTTCIEISPLHCAVLRAKGFKTIEADFLSFVGPQFDVVVLNPPFSEGRAKLHTEHASTKVKPGGRLVAILPASMRGKDFLGKGWAVSWSPVYEREFAGTSAAVVILKAVRVS